MANKIGLTLAFPSSALPLIQSHPLIIRTPQPVPNQELISAYFDTPDLLLRKTGIALSTQKRGKNWRQVVKCTVEPIDGLSSQPEWEEGLGGDFPAINAPAMSEWPEAPPASLAPCFITEFRRETHSVDSQSGVSILLMIDTGRISAEARERPINEIELDLVQGSSADLLNFAIALATDLPLLPCDQSKVQRGYRLFCQEAEHPVKAEKSPALPTWTPLQTFHSLALQAQACWQANLHGALVSADPEYIHQLRVALRRLRTLLKVYKSLLPREFTATWSGTLGDLAAGTGDARDLDVLRETILQPVFDAEDGPALEVLMQRAKDASLQARESTHRSLSSSMHGAQLLTFTKALMSLAEAKNPKNLTVFADSQLKRLRSMARKRLAVAAQTRKPADMHKLRVAFKHLRYGYEFFAPLFDASSMSSFAKQIAILQDDLGYLIDLNGAWNRLGDWAQGDAVLLEAREQVREWHARHADKVLATVFTRAKRLLKNKL